MIHALILYFDNSSHVKLLRDNSWSFIVIVRQAMKYLLLLVVYFSFTIALAIVEDYPGGVSKPQSAWILDMSGEMSEFFLAFAHIILIRYEILWHLLAGVMGATLKVWKAFAIAADVPNSEIKTTRDRFNAVGPGISTALKSCLILMALPSVATCPGINIRIGEPFELLIGRGKGLSHEEREILLAAVLFSRSPLEGGVSLFRYAESFTI